MPPRLGQAYTFRVTAKEAAAAAGVSHTVGEASAGGACRVTSGEASAGGASCMRQCQGGIIHEAVSRRHHA